VTSNDNSTYALNAQTGDLIWKYQTGGLIYSSPAVADGVLYVGSYDHNIYAIGSLSNSSSVPVVYVAVLATAVIIAAVVAIFIFKRRR
jgi:outer membrane protein assembly factor BamB